MRNILPKNIILLAEACMKETGKPLYAVGGSVRDFLAGFSLASSDFDLCAPVPADTFAEIAKKNGFRIDAEYRRTGTVKFSSFSSAQSCDFAKNGGEKSQFEYAAFRSDKYVRGEHTPAETFFTEDIFLDAKRRDFTCNAIYYDIARGEFEDPLGGKKAIRDKVLSTVDKADKVFGEDGLRLMRLARMAGTTGFLPDTETLAGAKHNAALIADVSPERIFTELRLILESDEKYGNKGGVYRALSLLDETRVLDGILPELTAGRGLKQRADFHDHDVLEHSLRAAAYADRRVRLAALLHDIGKPAAFFRDGKFSEHPNVGADLCREILTRLKAPAKETNLICELTLWHMYDYDLHTKENKLRKFMVSHADILDDLLLVKQADYSACKDDLSPAPCVVKWKELIGKMREEGAAFSLKELHVNGNDLAGVIEDKRLIGKALNALLLHVAVCPADNEKERLLFLAPRLLSQSENVGKDEREKNAAKSS